MATKRKVSRPKTAPKKRAEQPSGHQDLGLGFTRWLESLKADRGERDRGRWLAMEKEALHSPEHDSMRVRIEKLGAVGTYVCEGVTPQERLLAFASATAKAVAIASLGYDAVISDEPSDTEFTASDAGVVLLGLAAILDNLPPLLSDIPEGVS